MKKSIILIFFIITLTLWGISGGLSPLNDSSKIYFADVNNDGILDCVLATSNYVKVFKTNSVDPSGNTMDFSAPLKTIQMDSSYSPLVGFLTDIDWDGDFDLFFGTNYSTIGYYRNDGSPSNPNWVMVKSGSSDGNGANSYAGIYLYQNGRLQSIYFLDLDGDGDRDLAISDGDGVYIYYKNLDRENDGWVDGDNVSWEKKDSSWGPISSTNVVAKTYWFDDDRDGDVDYFYGKDSVGLSRKANNGSPGTFNMGGNSSLCYQDIFSNHHYISPDFEDFNGDGFLGVAFTYYDWGTSAFSYEPDITKNNDDPSQNTDNLPPQPGVSGSFQVDTNETNKNTVVVKWPLFVDADPTTDSPYRSGVKYYELYRKIDETGSYSLLWRHYPTAHWPDVMTDGFSENGDGFKMNNRIYYYKDANLEGGHTYYYQLKVYDYMGNVYTSSEINYTLEPPHFESVEVTLTPDKSNNTFSFTYKTLDQYGAEYAVTGSVTIETYKTDDTSLGYNLLNVDDANSEITNDNLNSESSKTYPHVTLDPSLTCQQFYVKVTVDAGSDGTFSGNSQTVTLDRDNPPLPANLNAPDNEITTSQIHLYWSASTDGCTGIDHYEIYRRATATESSYTHIGDSTTTDYLDTGLELNTTYRYYVVSVDEVGNESEVSDPDTIALEVTTKVDDTPPTAPSNLSATYTNNDTNVYLSWTASTDEGTGVAKYEIQRKTNTTFYETVHYVEAPDQSHEPATAWTDPSPPNADSIWYRVRAIDWKDNVSDWSNEAIVQTSGDDTNPPSVPTGVTASAIDAHTIRVSWNASTDPEGHLKGYKVYRTDVGFIVEVSSDNLSYADTGLTANTTYTYRVSSIDTAGNESALSASASATTPQGGSGIKPNTPQNLHVSGTTTTSITLAWDPPEDNGATISYYRIYEYPSFISDFSDATVVGTSYTTTFTHSGLQPTSSHYYSVTAVSSDNLESYPTPKVTGTTSSEKPSTPTNLTAEEVTSDSVTLSWNPSTPTSGHTIDHYNVWKATSTNPFGGYSYTLEGTSTGTSYQITGLDADTSYYFTVSAVDDSGNESDKVNPPLTVHTLEEDNIPPSTPQNFKGVVLSPTAIKLTWDPSTDNEGGSGLKGYILYRDDVKITDPPITETEYTDSDLEQLTTYHYKLYAVDNQGNQSDPAELSITTTSEGGTTLYCAQVASDDTWFTMVSVINVGDTDNPVQFQLIGEDGTPGSVYTLDSLPPKCKFETKLVDIFPDDLGSGGYYPWLKITSNSTLKGTVAFGTKDGEEIATLPLFERGANNLVFPYVTSYEPYWTGITFINVTGQDANVVIKEFSENGEMKSQKEITLAANGKKTFLLDGLFSDEEIVITGRLEISSDEPIIGFELFGSFEDKGVAGLPVFSLDTELFKKRGNSKEDILSTPSTPTGFMGSGISDHEIYFSWNKNPEPDIDHYTLINNDGPMPDNIVDIPGDSTNYTLSEMNGDALQPSTSYKFSLKAVNSNGEESSPTDVITVSTLPQGETDYPYHVFYNEILDTSKYFIGVTFANLYDESQNYVLKLYDKDGNVLAENDSLSLSPHVQRNNKLDDFFNNNLPDGASWLEVSGFKKFTGFELFLGLDSPFQFDGLIGLNSGSTGWIFPITSNSLGDGWDSEISITNVSNLTATVNINGYDEGGNVVASASVTLEKNQKSSGYMSDYFGDNALNVKWIEVSSDQAVISSIVVFSSDFKNMMSYIGIKGSLQSK